MTAQQTERDALIAQIKQYGGDGGSMYHGHLLQAADAMDAQALRIGELEKNAEADAFLIALANDNAARLLVERDALRAELDALRGQEPVGRCTTRPLRGDEWMEQSTIDWRNGPVTGELFTRPMPAQDVNVELVEALEFVMDRLVDTHESDVAACAARQAIANSKAAQQKGGV